MTDRAAVVARAIMQLVVAAPGGGVIGLEDAIAAYLRDEFSDIKQQTVSEIRREDE